MKPTEIKQILEQFKGQAVTNTLLKEYCNLNHFDLITESQYQDFLFQQEHDERVAIALPLIFAELSQFKYVPAFIPDEETKKLNEANNDIEWQIAKVLEDNNILYKEIDIVTKNLANALSGIMENAGRRANNMCAIVLSTLAKEAFGDPLKLDKLAEYYRSKAKQLGIELHQTQTEKLSTDDSIADMV